MQARWRLVRDTGHLQFANSWLAGRVMRYDQGWSQNTSAAGGVIRYGGAGGSGHKSVSLEAK